jgi:hypothetical protein
VIREDIGDTALLRRLVVAGRSPSGNGGLYY